MLPHQDTRANAYALYTCSNRVRRATCPVLPGRDALVRTFIVLLRRIYAAAFAWNLDLLSLPE